MSKQKIFITTPIYYVNDKPHLGHAYTSIAADVLARYYRSQFGNENVFFLTGTDEHGAKVAEAAKQAGKEPKEFVDELVPRFEETLKNLNISNDQFIRTTNPEHEKVVRDLIEKLVASGFVEKKSYKGLYCIGCERFLNKDELVDGKCPDHKTEPLEQSEENYFFLLSKFQDKLIKIIESGKFKIAPEGRKNEVLGKIKQDLEDVSISRQAVEWGISFPEDPKQTIYVWIDALINYFSATKIYDKADFWPPTLHLMAKDILWFHAVIWPALLMALELPLSEEVYAHGFFTIGGQKMSKTVGNVLDPNEMVKKFGADAVRYALLREFPFGEDGDISEEKIALRYEKDLANGLGNLVNRTLTLAKSNNIKLLKPKILVIDKEIYKSNLTARQIAYQDIENLHFHSVLWLIWKVIKDATEIIDKKQPWLLAKENKETELSKVLNPVYDHLISISELIFPFMPETAEKMRSQLETLEPEQLFPRISI